MAPDGSLEYVANSAAWSVVGVVGTLTLQKLKERKPMTSATRSNKPSWNTIIGFFIMAMSLISVVYVYGQTSKQSQFVACQGRVNAEFQRALQARQDIADQDRRTVDDLVIGVTQGQTPGERQAALVRYIRQRKVNDAERQRNPLPNVTDTCVGPSK